MAIQKRIHLTLSSQAIAAGQAAARQAGQNGLSAVVDRLLIATKPARKRSFSERMGGTVALRTPGDEDPRGQHLARKHQ